ncbi:MAG TPA: hypothetical protein VKU03_11110 [Roseiarcus sp.]|nr:hypothetical protein [Roseiarcus sp.]
MGRIFAVGALASFLVLPEAALALGPGLGLDADLGQLDAGLYPSDPASNAPGAGGVWTAMTGSNFTPAPSPTVRIRGAAPRFRIIRAPRITVTP